MSSGRRLGVAPQLATWLRCGARDEPLGRPGPDGRLRCGRGAGLSAVGLSGRARAVDEPGRQQLRACRPYPYPCPLALALALRPSLNQADSKLSEKLSEANFKQFLSQHEMTLVNFFAP